MELAWNIYKIHNSEANYETWTRLLFAPPAALAARDRASAKTNFYTGFTRLLN